MGGFTRGDNSFSSSVNTGLMLMGGLLSLATLSGYLFNNFGIKAIGAASTAVIGSSGPAVTSDFSFGYYW